MKLRDIEVQSVQCVDLRLLLCCHLIFLTKHIAVQPIEH